MKKIKIGEREIEVSDEDVAQASANAAISTRLEREVRHFMADKLEAIPEEEMDAVQKMLAGVLATSHLLARTLAAVEEIAEGSPIDAHGSLIMASNRAVDMIVGPKIVALHKRKADALAMLKEQGIDSKGV